MVDLSVSWDTTSPVLKKIADGPQTSSATSSLVSGAQGWFALTNNTGYILDIPSATWSALFTDSGITNTERLTAAADPGSDIVYIPNGSLDPNSNSTATRMLTINLSTGMIDSAAMHPSLNASRAPSAIWSVYRKDMLFYGGSPEGLFAYSNSTGWSDLGPSQTGEVPPPRSGACFVPVGSSGSKAILFGGVSPTGTDTLDDIYVLDIATLVWTKGPSAGMVDGRAKAACGVSNQQLVVWGGINSVQQNSNFPASTTLVFDLKSMTWQTGYVAGYPFVRMVVAICAGLLALFIAAGIVLYCIQKKRARVAKRQSHPMLDEIEDGEKFELPQRRYVAQSVQSFASSTPAYASTDRLNTLGDSPAYESTLGGNSNSPYLHYATTVDEKPWVRPRRPSTTSSTPTTPTTPSSFRTLVAASTPPPLALPTSTMNTCFIPEAAEPASMDPELQTIMIQMVMDDDQSEHYSIPEMQMDERTMELALASAREGGPSAARYSKPPAYRSNQSYI
ncbi:hypothetical protein BGZ98_010224 [Dissophora globulifera]|nr:hypothetical protein BGZ98_010224 [Dissophora globulifera]